MQNVRLFFEKGNAVKYISHLDLNRAFARAINRTSLPVWYTEGFNPHPFLVFSPPLSVGYIGENEIMDFKLNEQIHLNDIIKKLNPTLPNGLRINKAFLPINKISQVSFAQYKVEIIDFFDIEKLNSIKSNKEITIIKKTKSKEKELDLKEFFNDIDFVKEENCISFSVILPCDGNLSINPSLIVETIKKYVSEQIKIKQVIRQRFFNEKKELFL